MNQPVFRSSGDLLADRRYTYAQAALAQGDLVGAIDLLEQTLALAPKWAAAWFTLACAEQERGANAAAAAAFSQALACDPHDELGASLHLARLGAGAPPASAPAAYVQSLFDQYAGRFDSHLVKTLAYRAPVLLAEAVARLGAKTFDAVIDLGCGTGLCGSLFRPVSRNLTGVDLSPRMIEAAAAKNFYDHLAVADIVAYLRAAPAQSADLLLAADVFVYVGDLASVFAAASRVLTSGGMIAFTLQEGESGFVTGEDLRFSHGPDYVREALITQGLSVALLEQAASRRDRGADVPGLVVVAQRM